MELQGRMSEDEMGMFQNTNNFLLVCKLDTSSIPKRASAPPQIKLNVYWNITYKRTCCACSRLLLCSVGTCLRISDRLIFTGKIRWLMISLFLPSCGTANTNSPYREIPSTVVLYEAKSPDVISSRHQSIPAFHRGSL